MRKRFNYPKVCVVTRRIELRRRGYTIRGKVPADQLDNAHIFQVMQHIWIEDDPRLTTEARVRADNLFPMISGAPSFKNSKIADKQAFWRRLYFTLNHAHLTDSCIAYSEHPTNTPKIHLQVIQAADETGLVRRLKSKAGGKHVSRLLPLPTLEQTFATDPWEFDSSGEDRLFVFLRDRETEADLPIDWNQPTPQTFQRKLELINRVNAEHEITFHPFDKWDERFLGQRRLRPVHYAIFTDDWEHHGRLYTSKHGHQNLRGFERQLIRMDGEPSVEIDYSGFHPRLGYHLEGIDYQADPYALWGDDWGGNLKSKEPLRLMAKKLINAALNAEDYRATINACNNTLNRYTEKGRLKSGKAAEEARKLRRAKEKTGLKFSEIYQLALKKHQPIAHRFGSDAGMKFMNIDGELALEILHSFVCDGIPCLSIHDSFLVPRQHADRLHDEMISKYREKTGFNPVVEPVISPL